MIARQASECVQMETVNFHIDSSSVVVVVTASHQIPTL